MMCFAISATKANRLYWLGRYTERAYTSLHLLRRCYDKMIDGQTEDYEKYYRKMDVANQYKDVDSFRTGLMYDAKNPNSLISCLNSANDNGIVLREEIMSETLSYIQLSLVFTNKCAKKHETNITYLQPVTDYLLAFWGSVDERVMDERIKNFLEVGRIVEYLDMHIRYGYKYRRIEEAFHKLMRSASFENGMFDRMIQKKLEELFTADQYDPDNSEYVFTLLKYLNQLILL